MQQDTIFALSTPPGKSGVAVLRISGVQAADLLLALTKRPTLPAPRQATLSMLYGQDGTVLDKALILYFVAPHSFTGEDMVEFHTHGGTAIIRSLIDELTNRSGVRAAQPGEFMRRAFFNEKVDLLESEAIADLIDAETAAQLKQASKQMQGYHSGFYHSLRHSIIEILALLEAYIDFPEEDIPQHIFSDVKKNIASLKQTIAEQLDDNHAAERLRSGFHIAILGAPNVGKSTLLNQLAGRDAAIVTSHAGTTRDVIDLHLDIAGFPVTLSDTAGIRETDDEVEQLGVERSKKSADLADMQLLVVDATRFEETHMQALDMFADSQMNSVPALLVLNKVDALEDDEAKLYLQQLQAASSDKITISIAANTGQGLEKLENLITEQLSQLMPQESCWITQHRHRVLLESALDHLSADVEHLPLELFAEEIRLAAVSIGKITGTIIPDELLETIFSRFCIGK